MYKAVVVLVCSWLLSSCSDSEQRVVKVGISQWVSNQEFERNIAAFKEQLTRAGYIEGVSVEYIVGNPHANKSEQRHIIQHFIHQKVDLIYSLTTPGTLIAKELTQDIPIVFSIVTYPVEVSLIQSLDSSGNNLVGTRNYMPISRQLDTFLSYVADVQTIGFVRRNQEPNSLIQLEAMRRYAASQNITLVDINPDHLEQLPDFLQQLGEGVDALYSACDTMIQGGGEEVVIDYAAKNNIPDFTCNRSGVRKGSLLGNVADFSEIGALAGKKAVSILQSGFSPSELSTESPIKDFIVLNVLTARQLSIPLSVDQIKLAEEVVR